MTLVRAGVPITHRDRLPGSSRYELLVKIASGGMATVYVGRLSSAVGITRLVAVKRAHAHLLEDAAFGRMLIAEAKLASRIHHPNVVAVHNVEEIEGELLLVMDYVEGASLSDLMDGPDDDEDRREPLPPAVATRVLLDACAGLHAAHELTDDDGRPLGIVHRDVSPHNILVGIDGVARLTDFGIAKSSTGSATGGRTSTGALKGKVAYMAPEYVESGLLDARSDVFSLGIVAWESLTGRRLFRGATEVESLRLVLAAKAPRASSVAPELGTELDAVLARALARSPADRFATANDFAEALEVAARASDRLGRHPDVALWVRAATAEALAQRRALVRAGGGDPDDGPRPRAERTGSFVGVRERESEVRGRNEETAPAIAASTPPDHQTFGTGVSAHLVSDARAIPRSRGRALLAATGAAAIAVAAVAAFVILPSRATPPPLQPAARATNAAPAAASAPAPEPAPTVEAPASFLAPSAAPPRPPPRPARAARPTPAPAPRPAIVTALPPDVDRPPPKPTDDKAPPNPYAH